ncbi:hypothetical protein [Beduini massiliensis]|uniref:hypothetical protein n=1 Tax=Beduini massiliensis TaxID=1585974 RepID=UPI00059AAE69|nr:hypothetical protein [Beduini massiliensis]
MELINEEEIYDPIPIDEGELDVVLQLNMDSRIIAMDCDYLETDIIVKLKRKDLPLPYLEFAREIDQYCYINHQFVFKPLDFGKDPLQEIKEEQERQGNALQELITIILGEEV